MTAKPNKRFIVFALGAVTILAVSFVSSAEATHPRPKGATPIRVSLVPAYEQCAAPNRMHGPPLAFPSCSPPAQSTSFPGQASGFLTVGTPDANGAPANSYGFLRLRVIVGAPGPPDDSDVITTTSISDVRCKAGATPCGNANSYDGPDYVGELQGDASLRITDHFNAVDAGGGSDPATVVDVPFPVNLSCANTADTSTGAICNLGAATCLGCFGAVKDGDRTVVQVSQVRVLDGGADGIVATTPNTLFAVQGLFVP